MEIDTNISVTFHYTILKFISQGSGGKFTLVVNNNNLSDGNVCEFSNGERARCMSNSIVLDDIGFQYYFQTLNGNDFDFKDIMSKSSCELIVRMYVGNRQLRYFFDGYLNRVFF